MSNNQYYNLNARFTSISPLISANPLYGGDSNNYHKFKLEWEYPNQGEMGLKRPKARQYDIKAIRIYRYIGELDKCTSPYDIPVPPYEGIQDDNPNQLRLIYNIEQKDNALDAYQYIYTPSGPIISAIDIIDDGAIITQITNVTKITDDLSFYNENRFDKGLSIAHNLIDDYNNKDVLTHIYMNRRVIVYLIATYLGDAEDYSPYIIAPYSDQKIITAYSSKTQVRHDVLHYEFDTIWKTIIDSDSKYNNENYISRTAIDIDALYRSGNNIHRGPAGRGGFAWVSDRGSSGEIYRFNLSNGIQCGVGVNPGQINRTNSIYIGAPIADDWGHAITVDINTGNCWSGACQGSLYKIYNDFPDNTHKQILTNDKDGADLTWTQTKITKTYSPTQGQWSDWGNRVAYVSGADATCPKGTLRVTRDTKTNSANTKTYDTEKIGMTCGIYGAINIPRDPNWIAFCIKNTFDTKPYKYITGYDPPVHIDIEMTRQWYLEASDCRSFDVDKGYSEFISKTADIKPPIYKEYQDLSGCGIVDIVELTTSKTNRYPLTLNQPGYRTNNVTYSAITANPQYASRPYCINVGPNGHIFTINEKLNYIDFATTTSMTGKTSSDYWFDWGLQGTGITADIHNIYPNINNIFDANGNIDQYRIIHNDAFTGNVSAWKYDSNQLSQLSEKDLLSVGGINLNKYDIKALAVDDSNNIIGLGKKRVKIYRMDESNDYGDIYPFGGRCRYPNIPLEDQPFSLTNTREIEWFLTRDHYEMDNTIPMSFNNDIMTAREAWLSLVQFNRRESAMGDNDDNGWEPTHSDEKTIRFGIRINPEYYNIDDKNKDIKNDPIEIINLIREWAETYTTEKYTGNYVKNRTGRRLHPNFNRPTGTTGWIASPGNEIVSTGEISETNGYFRLEKSVDDDGYCDAYNQFTARASLSAGEALYNYDLIHPEVRWPSVFLEVTGSNKIVFNDQPIDCYPWPHYVDNHLEVINPIDHTMFTWATAVSSYDDYYCTFKIHLDPGTFYIQKMYFHNDNYPIYNTGIGDKPYTNVITIDNPISNHSIGTVVTVYNDPSVGGRIYIQPAKNEFINPYESAHQLLPRKNKVSLYNGGHFTPTAWVTARNLYEDPYTGWLHWSSGRKNIGCSPITAKNINILEIYERWPEPRFFQDITDTPDTRKIYFDTPTYLLNDPRYDKSEYLSRLSNENDAVRKDVIIGVEGLSATFLDRSIARSLPISSWTFNISSDIINHNMIVTHDNQIGLNDKIDKQSNFEQLTGIMPSYGSNIISLSAESLSAGTISDRIFSQCLNIKEMEPFAYYDIISGVTVTPDYNQTEDIENYYIDIIQAELPNATPTAYISGYAPYLKVTFKDASHPHTFPISAYYWDFGDIYNEEYTFYTANNITLNENYINNGHVKWKTDVSNNEVSHIYTIPGKYKVTLTVYASTSDTIDVYDKSAYPYNNETYEYVVEVKELSSTCGTIIGGLSPGNMTSDLSLIKGQGPLTAYFSLSEFIPGSFEPCQIQWHYNDHIITINKYPKTTITSQGVPIEINETNMASTIVPIVLDSAYERSRKFKIYVSVIMCNTSSVTNCGKDDNLYTGDIIPSVGTPKYDSFKSRIDEEGNLIYVFTNKESGYTHTVMLSSEVKEL